MRSSWGRQLSRTGMRIFFENAPGLACKIVNMGDESFHDVAETRFVWCLIDPLDIFSDVLTSQIHHRLLILGLIHDAKACGSSREENIKSSWIEVDRRMMIPRSIIVVIIYQRTPPLMCKFCCRRRLMDAA